MNRFHSSGTASGNVEVMWTWKITIPITAIVADRAAARRASSRSGRPNSITVPMCAASAAQPRGPQVLRVVAVELRLAPCASGSTACC